MAVTSAELDAILDHCRSLIDAASDLSDEARARANKADIAGKKWEGPHYVTFTRRLDAEAQDLAARSRELRAEADAWAQAWADNVNRLNRQRREEAIDLISSQRGFGESFVDVFVGDDSGDQVRDYEPVSVPVEDNRYAPTGQLESF